VTRVALTLGVDVGATTIVTGLVDVDTGEIHSSRSTASEVHRGGAAVLEDCVRLARQLADPAPAAVGISVCEAVDLEGHVTSAFSFDWRHTDVAGAFADIAPACVDSDVRAAALAEAVWGTGRRHASFLYVNAGSGISSTLVVDGTPYAGAHGNAILIGAGPIDAEAAASGTALRRRHGVSGLDLARAAEAGDRAAERILEEAGGVLGEAIAFAVNLVDPEVVVVGGGLALGSETYSSAAEAAMRKHIWAESAKAIPFLGGDLGTDAALLGAALTASTRLLGSR